jgi:hypothetical protein
MNIPKRGVSETNTKVTILFIAIGFDAQIEIKFEYEKALFRIFMPRIENF